MITLSQLDTSEELAEALYYAHISAQEVRWANPHDAPRAAKWEELEPGIWALWTLTAKRLLALNA